MIRVSVEVDGLEDLLAAPSTHILTALNHGAFLGAQAAKGLWIRLARQAKIHDSGAYVNAIDSEGAIRLVRGPPAVAPGGNMPPRIELIFEVTNDCEHASIVEEGHAAFHLPSRVDWGSGSVKRGKKGPYLHIPFRHRAYSSPSARKRQGLTASTRREMMPADIYREAKKMGQVLKRHMGPIRKPSGQFVAADKYLQPSGDAPRRISRPDVSTGFRPAQWTGELIEERRGRRHVAPGFENPAWQASKFQGMFRTGSTGADEGTYLTIRTMTPNSRGWNIPAQMGHYLASKTVQGLQNDNRLAEAVMIGVQEVLSGRGPS